MDGLMVICRIGGRICLGLSILLAGECVCLQQAAAANDVVIELFIRSDSEQSRRAKEFLLDLDRQREGVSLQVFDVLEDRAALARLWELTRRYGRSEASVPTAYLCNRLFVGFRDGKTLEDCLTIHAYVRSGCSYCRNARAYLNGLQQRWPAIRVAYYDVVQNPQAQRQLDELARRHGSLRTVPSFYVAGRLIPGYRGANITGRQIEQIFVHRSSGVAGSRTTGMSSRSLRSVADDAGRPVSLHLTSPPAAVASFFLQRPTRRNR